MGHNLFNGDNFIKDEGTLNWLSHHFHNSFVNISNILSDTIHVF